MTRRLSGLAAIAVCVVVVPAPASAQGDDAGGRRLTLADYMEMESVSNPQISPDGRQIVYTRGWVDQVNDSRESSLWIMNADGSRNRHLIEGTGARWSPDGTRMLYTARGEPSGSQVFVRWMDAEGATSQITRLEHGPSSPRWSPDGQRIAFTSRMDDQAAFAGVDLPGRPDGAKWTGEPKVVERAGYKRDRAGYIDTGWTHLFVVPADGGTARQLTDGDWNHEGVAWSVDGAEIYFSSYRADDWDRPSRWQESEIYAVDVATERIRQLTDRRGSDRAPVPSPDGRLIAYIAGDEHRDTFRNPRIWVMSPDGSNPRLISGPYDRQSGGLRWAPDGRGLYFSVRRDGYQSLHFVALDGGVTQFTDGAQLFSLASFADHGTARRHDRGRARAWRPLSLRPVGAERRHPPHRGERRRAPRLFVYGCSGGGILTSYIVGNTDRFAAASANCPIVNWMSAMGTSDAITYARTFAKPFWEDPTEWIDRSSIFYVGNVTTPTLLMTGENDLRTPMGQTEEYYQALQYQGVPTVMVRFQDEWHGTSSKPSNFMRTQLYLRKWFDKWGTHDKAAATDGGG